MATKSGFEKMVENAIDLKDLFDAAVEVDSNGPCSDPDCCKTAIANAEARVRLRKALKKCWHLFQESP